MSVSVLLKKLTFLKCQYIAVSVLLVSCSSVDIETYKHNSPKLVVEEFFNGNLSASGIVKNRSGKVIRYFNANIIAKINENQELVLYEHFLFSDNEQQDRTWVIKNQGDGSYLASANDVVGEWPITISGNAMHLKYILRVPYKKGTIDVKVDDKMYLVNENTLINESILTKFGFEMASITLQITKIQ